MPCSTEDDLFPQRYEIDYVRVYQLSNCSLLGDYNQDNSLDILDVVSVVEVIVSQTDDYNECIDINEDGDVNVIDIVMVVDEIIR